MFPNPVYRRRGGDDRHSMFVDLRPLRSEAQRHMTSNSFGATNDRRDRDQLPDSDA